MLSIFVIFVESLKSIASLLLVCWHIYLKHIGITTYQFLVEKEEIEKLKLQLNLKQISLDSYNMQYDYIVSARSIKSIHKIK